MPTDLTLEARFGKLDQQRSAKLNRARAHAELVMPGLLPWEGASLDDELPVPYSSLPAEGTLALAARMVSVIYPLNNIPFFQLAIDDQLIANGEDTTQEEAVLARFERRVMDQLLSTNLRPSLFLCYQHLISIGDVLLFQRPDYDFQVFRLDQYVVKRSPDGNWKELIIQEWVDAEYLPQALRNMPVKAASQFVGQAHAGSPTEMEAIYTQVKWNPDTNVWDVKKEFRGSPIEELTHYEVPPYYPLRWNGMAGEDYGRSLIEDSFGDVRCLDALSKALMEGSLLNAEYRWGCNPAGITEIKDWENSSNGMIIPAVSGDIFPIQAENQAQVEITLRAVTFRENRLGRRFLMNSVAQPTGERVTAKQVSIIAQELEQTLGGTLSFQARDIQIPLIRRTMYMMSRDKKLPEQLMDIVKNPDSILKLNVKAGLEILNREAENEKLTIVAQAFQSLPPEALSVFNWAAWMEKWMVSFGIETTGLIKTPEQMAAEQQAAMQQQQAQMAGQAAMEVATKAATAPPASGARA